MGMKTKGTSSRYFNCYEFIQLFSYYIWLAFLVWLVGVRMGKKNANNKDLSQGNQLVTSLPCYLINVEKHE